MQKLKFFLSLTAGNLSLPVFFPDATKAVVRTLTSEDIIGAKTEGVLVNTYHLIKQPGKNVIQEFGGVRNFMNFKGAVISDSGGFQVGSLVKKNPELGKVTDKGVYFKFPGEKATLLTPEISIDFQLELKTDMVVALDDFDAPNASIEDAKDSVRRTILWAERSKLEFERICKLKNLKPRKDQQMSNAKWPMPNYKKQNNNHLPPTPYNLQPYLLGVIQGGRDKKLRKYCIKELLNIGFDGLGYGGEEKVRGDINTSLAKYISRLIPDNYFKYALGVGKPEDIVNMTRLGWNIFDCVLPSRDARHKRMYVFNADNANNIDCNEVNFYSYFIPDKEQYRMDKKPVSKACDCLLCKNYSRAYLYHLFKEQELSALRLSTIHNLRFYSLLMEKIREQIVK